MSLWSQCTRSHFPPAMGARVLMSIRPACTLRAPSSLRSGCWSLAGREVRGSGEFGLRFEIGDPLAQSRKGTLQRL